MLLYVSGLALTVCALVGHLAGVPFEQVAFASGLGTAYILAQKIVDAIEASK